MAAVWLHDGLVKGTGMLKNRDCFFYFLFFIGIHIFIILTIVVYNANVTGYTNITHNTTATLPYYYLL